MSRHATWLCGLLCMVAAGCSSTDTHPPLANNDCHVGQNCHNTSGGISSTTGGGTGGTGQDAARQTTDSGARSCGTECAIDPTFGVRLCARSLVCPGVIVDR